MGKRKAIETEKNLKEHVDGAGLLCIGMYPGDFFSIGASIFIGYSRVQGEQVRVSVITPPDHLIQRYEFRIAPFKLPYEDDQE